jgi:adenosylcobinamide-phosphate synthase
MNPGGIATTAGGAWVPTVAALGTALALELAVGELPESLHPVALFGRVVAPLDRSWSRPRAVGAVAGLALPLAAAAAVGAGVGAAGWVHPVAGVAAAGVALFVTTSLRLLLDIAGEVVDASETDLASARESVGGLVGRDVSDLSAGQVRSAAVESAAENLADGLVAPLLAFALLAPVALGLGAAAAAWVKAVNTMDSMLGYREKPVGWASARLDDVVMWVPARASAALVAVAAGDRRALAPQALETVPSPNSGWPMGALAAALGARLEKPGVYALNPAAELPTPETARRGVGVVWTAGVLAYLGAAALALAVSVAAAGVIAWS